MSTCTSCNEVLSSTSPSFLNQCSHVFHKSCALRIWKCPSCKQLMDKMDRIYCSVSTCNNMGPSANVRKAIKRIEELKNENESLKNAPDCDYATISSRIAAQKQASRKRQLAYLEEQEELRGGLNARLGAILETIARMNQVRL